MKFITLIELKVKKETQGVERQSESLRVNNISTTQPDHKVESSRNDSTNRVFLQHAVNVQDNSITVLYCLFSWPSLSSIKSTNCSGGFLEPVSLN